MVTNWPDFDIFSTVKQLSEHSNNEWVLLHVDADLLLLGVFSWSNIFGIWSKDFECLGGLGGGAFRSSGLDSLLHEMAVGNWLGRNLWGSITCWTITSSAVCLAVTIVRSVQDSAEERWLVARDLNRNDQKRKGFLQLCSYLKDGEVKFLLWAVSTGLGMRDELLLLLRKWVLVVRVW